jgi:YbgC/YbaW family acyl-CoA thioester hydrolase
MCGVSYPEMINNRKIGFPVVHVETDFIAPLRYGDVIHATIAIERVGTSSVTWNYRLHNQDGTLLWASTQVTVCVDMDSLESQPVPDDLRQGLLNHLMEVEQ